MNCILFCVAVISSNLLEGGYLFSSLLCCSHPFRRANYYDVCDSCVVVVSSPSDFPPPHFHLDFQRWDDRLANPQVLWACFQRLDVVVGEKMGEDHLELVRHKETAGAVSGLVLVVFQSKGGQQQPRTYHACRPWPKARWLSLVVTMPSLSPRIASAAICSGVLSSSSPPGAATVVAS